jgi:3-hydroxyisobutyrate dehydrogenase-like beta-hydroxyacid dehydrogenase
VTKPLVAIIAPGNMGAAVAARLTESGVTVLTSLEGRSAESVRRAKAAGMTPAPQSEIAASDILLSIVPPGDAHGLAEMLTPALKASNRKPVYVDCNAVSPATVATIAAAIEDTGAPFVDGGIIGAPPKAGSDATRIYVSGPDAARVETLNDYGLQVRNMAGKVGDASALKMSYAGLTKGLVALGAAMIAAAQRSGVSEALRAELGESQTAILAQLTRGVPGMFPKAYRWVAELEEIGRFAGPEPEGEIYSGIARLYERIAADVEGPQAETGKLAEFFAARRKDQ